MNRRDLRTQLDRISQGDDFVGACASLIGDWERLGIGIDGVEVILRFMEDNPSIDYGMPGPVVHFAEKFYRRGYEPLLIESVRRRPTPHTAWMVGRVMNGLRVDQERKLYEDLLNEINAHEKADDRVRSMVAILRRK